MLFWFVYGSALAVYLGMLVRLRHGKSCVRLGRLLVHLSRVGKEKTLLECVSRVLGSS